MSDPIPAPTQGKSSQHGNEVSISTSISDIQRNMVNQTLKVSKNSPPTMNDLKEMQPIFDKSTGKLHILVNGVSKSVQFT